MDSGVGPDCGVPPMYDPLLAKLIVWAPDRQQATRHMLRALSEYEIEGIKTLLPFHRALLRTQQWARGETCRDLIGDRAWLKSLRPRRQLPRRSSVSYNSNAMDVWELPALSPERGQPEVLRSDDGAARVIAIMLSAGDVLAEHQVHEHAWLAVLDGRLEVTSGPEAREVGQGSLLHFDPGERREVRARDDTRLLYLLAPWPGPGHPSLRSVTTD